MVVREAVEKVATNERELRATIEGQGSLCLLFREIRAGVLKVGLPNNSTEAKDIEFASEIWGVPSDCIANKFPFEIIVLINIHFFHIGCANNQIFIGKGRWNSHVSSKACHARLAKQGLSQFPRVRVVRISVRKNSTIAIWRCGAIIGSSNKDHRGVDSDQDLFAKS